MMNRRRFLKRAGAFLGVATVAPAVALEVTKPTIESAWATFTPDVVAADVASIYAGTASGYGLQAFVFVMNCLFGKDGWRIVTDYSKFMSTIHIPASVSDHHFMLLQRWSHNHRCIGELWKWQRGNETPVDGTIYVWDEVLPTDMEILGNW